MKNQRAAPRPPWWIFPASAFLCLFTAGHIQAEGTSAISDRTIRDLIARAERAEQSKWSESAGTRTDRSRKQVRPKARPVTVVPSNKSVRKIIAQAAEDNDVPVKFALAVAEQESTFNANATGAHKEIGLFQLKCETAKTVLGYKGSCRALYDPALNAHWGTLHLRRALNRTGDSWCKAATLHNRGLESRPVASSYCLLVLART